MPRFHAVVFDLDGTLLDTLSDIAAAANEVLVQHDAQPLPVNNYRHLVGDGVVSLFARAFSSESDDDPRIADCAMQFREAYGRTWNQQTQPYAGIIELLEMLSSQGIVTAVLSNKPHEFTKRCVGEFLGHHLFGSVLGQREGVPRKPHPAGAVEVAEQLGVPCQQCAYLGDTSTDMQTARAAGMFAVGVSWGFRPRQELVESGASRVIDDPLEFLELLEVEPT